MFGDAGNAWTRVRRGRSPFAVALIVISGFALLGGALVIAKPLLLGSERGERLVGTIRADKIVGRGGNDLLVGRQGPDRLLGGRGDDILRGAKGNDRLKGGPGNDRLLAGKGNDRMYGGPGRDQFNMVRGVQIDARGDNRIYARDGELDEINCGTGFDIAYVDRAEDGVYGCEVIKVPRP